MLTFINDLLVTAIKYLSASVLVAWIESKRNAKSYKIGIFFIFSFQKPNCRRRSNIVNQNLETIYFFFNFIIKFIVSRIGIQAASCYTHQTTDPITIKILLLCFFAGLVKLIIIIRSFKKVLINRNNQFHRKLLFLSVLGMRMVCIWCRCLVLVYWIPTPYAYTKKFSVSNTDYFTSKI
ncbi:hypothetical protein BpHYR1_037680 [Brachionus plicatilis]|uniref:Uncharacterized protein n=1 Tax=Brachionus plicatilis TaxID=10195 RepID=A0A3M7QVY7_BRAPC|nr:hypothetical protein BpHYR1_037680 [Brachionus plicatilis]